MATRNALAAMARAYESRFENTVAIESVGGIVAARRIAQGEAFDFVVLASNALSALASAGHVDARTCTPLAHSSVAVAVATGSKHPDIASESAVRAMLLDAGRIGYSTGPSGDRLVALVERWGLSSVLAPRLVLASAGVPVAALVARGDVELGFQQLSEVTDVPGVDVVGVLPPSVAPPTLFAGAVCSSARHATAARELLAFFASDACTPARHRNGMAPP